MLIFSFKGFKQTTFRHVRLMQRTAGKRALMWFCIPWALALIALIPGQDSWIAVADMLFVGFFNPFFVQAWTCYKCVKQGTFDNPRSGILLKLFCFIKVVSYIFLIPLRCSCSSLSWALAPAGGG